ncbi:MAG: hypothetical protein LC637_06545 [Xanthomonadaceae bacterium]|nr:hypothetical protein [Xanthomonadaceae bacterium]
MAARAVIRLAVFGLPVEHSLSPAIHRRFAADTGSSVDYRAIECPGGRLAERLEAFAKQGGTGCNLTVPLKAEGLKIAQSVSVAAARAGACNTLLALDGGGWRAENTDGTGLTRDLARLKIELCGQRILVIGAGGAVAGANYSRGLAKAASTCSSRAPAWDTSAAAHRSMPAGCSPTQSATT